MRVLLKGAPEQMTALYSSYAQGDADPKPMDEARAVHPPAPVPPGRCMHPLFRPAAVQHASRPLVHERASSDLMLPAPRVCYVVALSLSLSLLQHVRSELEASTMRMGEQGLRCIAVAYRDLDIDASVIDASVSHLPPSEQGRTMIFSSQPRFKNNHDGKLFCTYAYPAPYPEGTRSTRLSEEVVF